MRPLLTSDDIIQLKREDIIPVKSPEAPTALTEMVTAFFRNQFKIAAAVLVFLALLTGILVLRPKTYESRMVFLVRDEAGALSVTSFDEHSVPATPISDVQIGTEIELLSGNGLRRAVVAALNPGLSRSALDRRLLEFNKALSVLPVPKTTLFSVTYSASSEQEANRTLATLSQLYLAYRASIRGTDGAYAFIDQQAVHYYKKLQEDQAALAAFNQEFRVTSVGSEKEDILRKVEDARANVYETEASRREADKQIQAMVAMRNRLPVRVTTQRRDLPDQAVAERLNTTLVDLENKRVELITKYLPTDRHVQEIDQQIKNTRDALDRAQKSVSREEQTDLNPIRQDVEADLQRAQFKTAGLLARERSLEGQVNDYQAKLQQLNHLTGNYEDLTRKVKEDESNYDLYSKKREDARISRNLDTDKLANVRQIDGPAVVPQSRAPVVLGMTSIYVIGVSVIIGGGILCGLWSPRFHSPSELEAAIGSPVLATVPVLSNTLDKEPPIRRSELSDAQTMMAMNDLEVGDRVEPTRVQVLSPVLPFSAGDSGQLAQAAGVYLPLIQKLRKIDSKEPGGGVIFAVTACTRGEGVSHFVRGLGAELTNYSGKRVAIVNATAIFETIAEAGNDTDALIWGRSATSGEKFIQQWFKALRETHDCVLIDCPSLNASRAATILGPQSDGVLLLVGTGKATRTQVRGALNMLTLASVKVLGLALNKRKYPIPESVYNLL